MSNLVTERLPGCNADTLDAYLRGLGFFLLAGQVEPSVRAWWDEDGVIVLTSAGLETLADRVADQVVTDCVPTIGTPWRGASGKGRGFVSLRNEAADEDLDWMDACALPRATETGKTAVLSDRENNPLLGQGGGFGRSEVAAAHDEAVNRLRRSRLNRSAVVAELTGLLRGAPGTVKASRTLSITKAVLGAYQSGRATGPGLSARDVEATSQNARASAWDIILVIAGLRAFRGSASTRPDSRARVQASFPLVVRSRPLAAGRSAMTELRADPPETFELLAPLWSQPCTSRAFLHLLRRARLRTNRGVARDTLDAVLAEAANAAHGLGFDRLARFAFVSGSDPRYRYSVARGRIRARAHAAAQQALVDIVPFLRMIERAVRDEPPALLHRPSGRQRRRAKQRAVRDEPPALLLARRRAEDALAALGQRPLGRDERLAQAREAQGVLVTLAELKVPAARLHTRQVEELSAPFLSPRWFRLADDESAEYRLARALIARLATEEASLLRTVLLPERGDDRGRWVLDRAVTPPELEYVGDPLASLTSAAFLALRRSQGEKLASSGAARLEDIVRLLSGSLGRRGERRLALLAGALAGVRPAPYEPRSKEVDPRLTGLDSATGRILLACQPSVDEQIGDPAVFERADAIGALALAGNLRAAHVAADRELRRRGLDLLPAPSSPPAQVAPARLALACLLPLDETTRDALGRLISVTPARSLEGGLT